MADKDITIVIPAKDEEKTIGRCIESVIEAFDGFYDFEIILVDSFSSDHTVEVAKKYPIRILRLKKKWPKSPAAGRYIGTINSAGKYVLFLDADMTLNKSWIKKGLKVIENSKNTAGVTGAMYSYLYAQNAGDGRAIHLPFGLVPFLPGAGMYKRSVLDEVGHFNPFMKGFEERELGARIKRKGYRQACINEVISYHFEKAEEVEELSEKASYFTGVGQFLRLHFSLNNLIETIKRYQLVFITQLLLLFFVLVAIYSNAYDHISLSIFLFIFYVILMLTLVAKQKNLKKSFIFGYFTIAKSYYFYKGLLTRPKKIDSYPTDAEVIQ